MLKNLTIGILRSSEMGDLEPAEIFNWDFAGIAYYYWQKLKKIKIPGCTYIKIAIANEEDDGGGIKRFLHDGMLVIRWKCDFSKYILLSVNEKKNYQQRLINYILMDSFIELRVSTGILDGINKELQGNGNNLEVCFFTKKIKKGYRFKMMMYLELDSFRFTVQLIDVGALTELLLIRSRPEIYIIHYLFKKWRVSEEFIKIGHPDQQIFQVDLQTKKIIVLEAGKKLFSEWAI